MLIKKIAAAALAGASVLSLSGCLTLPGEFTSEVTLLKDGSYAFSYNGDVQIMSLAMMIDEMSKAESNRGEFTPYCYGPTPDGSERKPIVSDDAPYSVEADAATMVAETVYDVESDESAEYGQRECTAAETAEQVEQNNASIERQRQEQEQMAQMLGGLNPSDPETFKEFAEKLERQAGWQKVEYVSGGTFNVIYSTKGMLPDNFGFPIIADVPTGQPFLTIDKWDEGQVQVSAPGFQSGPNGVPGSLGMMAMLGSKGPSTKEMDELGIKPINGTFTVKTDGKILTNNTDKGPKNENGLQVMRWKVNNNNTNAPVTLIQF